MTASIKFFKKRSDAINIPTATDYLSLYAKENGNFAIKDESGNTYELLSSNSPSITQLANLTVGDAGTEGTGINVSGITFQSTLKVSDIDGSNFAQTILHRHSTVLEPLILGARTNSDTSAHANVAASQNLFTIYAAGYAGNNYKLAGSISIGVDSTGSISDTSLPGKMVFAVTPNGSVTPATWLSVTNDKTATFAGNVTVTGDFLVNGTTTTINTENLVVEDKNITINYNGVTASTTGAGINIEGDAGAVVGYMRVGSSDNSLFEFKSPTGNVLTLDVNADKTLTVAGALNVTADSVINQNVSTTGAPSFASATATDATTPFFATAPGKTNTGYMQVNGKTSGALKITTADAAGQTITVNLAAQTVGAATLTLPNMAGVSKTLAWLESPAFTTPNLGTPSAGVATNLTGTAAGLTAGNATTLATARTIGGVSFNGSANITVASATSGFAVSGSPFTSTAQPAFMAYNATGAVGVTGDGTLYTVLCDTEIYDQAGNYNPATGTFTAPVAGRYRFDLGLLIYDIFSNHTRCDIFLVTSNRTYKAALFSPFATRSGDGYAKMGCASFLVDMDASDAAYITINVSGGGKNISVFGGTGDLWTTFSGNLVC